MTKKPQNKKNPKIKKDQEMKKRQEQKDELSILQEENGNLKLEVEKLKDQWIRTMAEFDNFRKRNLKERQEWIKYANRDLVLELIDVLENMEKSIESLKTDKKFKTHLQGIKLVYDQFFDILKKRGLKKMEVLGENFDPQLHDALIFTPNENYDENVIFDCILNGYFFDDKVLRHAKVAVTQPADEDESKNSEDTDEENNIKNNKNEVNDNE
ncbi:MAG: nucleotide exchange factor GrpE [Candidatus Cloacimonadota bacterium]|nr:nucleotide exchange factor GrpE [Candidatus Cloacimonadota bacterium]